MGISFGYLWSVFTLLLLVGWIVLAVLALVHLRRLALPETARAVWALLIVVVPLAGAIAFWIVSPGRDG
jgi:hypothetical protein